MSAVLDASAAVEIAQRTDAGAAHYRELFNHDEVYVPNLYFSEVSNALWKAGRKQTGGSQESLFEALECLIDLPSHIVSGSELCKEALSEALKSDHPVYDMMYAVLARRENAILITGDRRLSECARAMGIRVSAR